MSCCGCKGTYEKKILATHLSGQICVNCNVISFTLSDYLYYLSRKESMDDKFGNDYVIEEDTKRAMICNCGSIMNKYRINHESERRVDYCHACQAICLDKGEWEYLNKNNLHRCINKIFTSSYQRDLRHKRTKAVLNNNYEEQFGAKDYKQIKEIRDWKYQFKKRDVNSVH